MRSPKETADPSTGTQNNSHKHFAQEDDNEDDATVQDGSPVPTSSTVFSTPSEMSPMGTPSSEKGEDGKTTAPTPNELASSSKNASSASADNVPQVIPATQTTSAELQEECEEKVEEVPAITPVPGSKRTIQRPTFVQLPSPTQFPIDGQFPASPSTVYTPYTPAISSYSASSISPLAMFDATHARGSPSSLNAGMSFEPAAGMSVLVVDDDSLTRTLMKRILTRLGCHVSVAENGEVALEMILGWQVSVPASTPSSDYSKREAKPILEQEVAPGSTSASTPTGSSEEYKYAVVFLDNQMPVMSGLKVVAKLREMRRKDFVVGVTGEFDSRYLSLGL
jgi:CheY-like chemotaxis protein